MTEQTTSATAQETTNAAAQTTEVNASATATAPAADTQTQQQAQAQAGTQDAKFDLAVPEESFLTETEVESLKSYAKEKGLSKDQAQELLNQRHAAKEDLVASYKSEQENLRTQWLADAKNDKEFGGQHFAQNVEFAKRSLEKFATPEIVGYLNQTGLGNNPEVIRLFYRIGKAMSNDSIVNPGSAGGPVKKPIEEVFYGKQQT
jgi:hypothetical protein